MDDVAAGIRMFDAGSGPADPTAAPVVAENVDGRVVGRATVGLAHEGHFTLAHGGVLAVLLDDVLGRTVIAHATAPAMTAGLELRLREEQMVAMFGSTTGAGAGVAQASDR